MPLQRPSAPLRDFYVETGQGRSAVSISRTQVGKTLTVIGGDSIDQVRISGTTTQEGLNLEVPRTVIRHDAEVRPLEHPQPRKE